MHEGTSLLPSLLLGCRPGCSVPLQREEQPRGRRSDPLGSRLPGSCRSPVGPEGWGTRGLLGASGRASLAGREAGGLRVTAMSTLSQPSIWFQRKVPALREPWLFGS